MPEEVYFVRSDQYSFVRQGVPSIFVSEGFKAQKSGVDGKKMSLEWEAKFYHTPKDDMSQPFDFGAAVHGTQVQFLIGYLTAQDDQRPAWNAGDFFGKVFGEASGR